MLAVAEQLKDIDDLRFLFIGDGVRRREIERHVSARNVMNVVLLPYQDSSVPAQSLSAGNINYISLRTGFEGLVD